MIKATLWCLEYDVFRNRKEEASNVPNENSDGSDFESDSDNDDDLFVNPNHRPIFRNDEESDESDSSEEEDEDEDDQNGNSIHHQNDGKTVIDDGENCIEDQIKTVKIWCLYFSVVRFVLF